jgi:hypothetical protein
MVKPHFPAEAERGQDSLLAVAMEMVAGSPTGEGRNSPRPSTPALRHRYGCLLLGRSGGHSAQPERFRSEQPECPPTPI